MELVQVQKYLDVNIPLCYLKHSILDAFYNLEIKITPHCV